MNTNDAIHQCSEVTEQLAVPPKKEIPRLKSGELMQHKREVEIDHEGRIYRLRITHLNKLILTA